jgi:predicted DNA-binding transcriptional regulator YafY
MDLAVGLKNSVGSQLSTSLFTKICHHKENPNDKNHRIVIDLNPWDDKLMVRNTFDKLYVAIETRQLITFKYFKPGSISHLRRVKPLRLILKGASWYLKAFCLYANDFRLFKFSRIDELKLLDTYFESMDDDLSEEDYLNLWYGHQTNNLLKVRFYQPIYGLLDHLVPLDSIKWTQESFEYDLPFEIDDWLLRVLFGLFEHVEILDENLKQAYKEKLDILNLIYQ